MVSGTGPPWTWATPTALPCQRLPPFYFWRINLSPFWYAISVLGGLYILMMVSLYYTNWELIDARKKAAEWEEKARDAWERLRKPPTWMQESGLDVQVGEQRVPLYKPFGVFEFTGVGLYDHYTVLDGDRIVETQLLPAVIDVVNGDKLYLYCNVKK